MQGTTNHETHYFKANDIYVYAGIARKVWPCMAHFDTSSRLRLALILQEI